MNVPVGYDYVLILEWLKEDDLRTGADLHQFLEQLGFRSEHVVCGSWDDVEGALAAAVATRELKGVPVVHLETHGADPWREQPGAAGLGPYRDDAAQWAALGPLLAPLNVCAGFRLLVVSAACWGSGLIAAIGGGEHFAPFACAVGLRTEVRAGRLRDAMRELYRGLNRRDELVECVAGAQRELVAGEELQLEVILDLAYRMLRTVYYRPRPSRIGPLRRSRRAREVWSAWFPPEIQNHIPAYRFENTGIGP